MLPSSAAKFSAPLHGLWRVVPSPMLSEIFAQGGLDFQILDCEHGAYDYATLLPDILACEGQGCAPLVRVGGQDKIEVQRCLDLGAHGLVFPQLNAPDDFARAAATMDYAPAGTRGYNPFVRAGRYGTATSIEHIAKRPVRPWFVPIIETLAAAEQIETIVQLQRIDLVYIGVYDLSAQLGSPEKMDSAELKQIVDRILSTCARAQKPVAMMALSAEAAKALAARGLQALVHGIDTQRVRETIDGILQATRDLRLS